MGKSEGKEVPRSPEMYIHARRCKAIDGSVQDCKTKSIRI